MPPNRPLSLVGTARPHRLRGARRRIVNLSYGHAGNMAGRREQVQPCSA